MTYIIDKMIAIVAAFLFASQGILVRKSVSEGGDVLFGTLINVLVGVVVLWPLAFLMHQNPLDLNSLNVGTAIVAFVITGLLIQTQRIPIYLSFSLVGTSISQPIQGSYPLFAAIAALFLIGEKITGHLVIAALMIIFGVYLIGAGGKQANVQRKELKLTKGMLISLFAAANVGVGHVVRKISLNMLNMPILGAAVSQTAAAIVVTVASLSYHRHLKVSLSRKSFFLFFSSGFVGASAAICAFYAMSMTLGEVAIISAFIATVPLHTLILNFIFLRKVELLNIRIILGCLIIVLSTVLLLLAS